MAAGVTARGPRLAARLSAKEQVREQLLAAIDNGQFPPGSLLPSERVLVETFRVSRATVRQVIAGLEAMGLVTVRHGRGAYVEAAHGAGDAAPFARYLEPYRDRLVELLDVRGALDELAAEEAALHGKSDVVLEVAEKCLVFRQAAEKDGHDLAGLAELDIAFHLSIAKCSGTQLLLRLLRELNALLPEPRRVTLGLEDQVRTSVKQHQAIADAIMGGDARRARLEARRHVADIRLRLQEPDHSGAPS